jgi:hypothetical protein
MIINDLFNNKKIAVAEAGFPGAPDVEMPPMKPSGDPERDKLKKEYVDLHREIKSLVDAAYGGDKRAKARIAQLNDRADQIRAILEPRQPPNEWQKKTYGYDDNWNIVKKGVAEGRFVRGPGGVPLDRQGRPVAPKAPKAEPMRMRQWVVHHEGQRGEGGEMIIDAPNFETAWELANEYDLDIIDIKPVKGVAEGTSNIGNQIKALYQKIHAQGDDAVEFMYYDSPIFAQYWDEYEGDLDSIIAEVDPGELQIIHDELLSAAEQQGMAEGSFDHWSPMGKDSIHQDRIRSLQNLIAIAKEQGRQLRVQELELALKKLQGVSEDNKPVNELDKKTVASWVRQQPERIKGDTGLSRTDFKKAKRLVDKSIPSAIAKYKDPGYGKQDPRLEENMADDMAAMAQKKFPNAYISKDGQEVQKPENWGKKYVPPTAAPADLEKQQRDLTAKYPNIDELVRRAELNRDPDYEMADGEAYYAARDAEQNYQKLRQIQRVIQGLNESLNRSHLP